MSWQDSVFPHGPFQKLHNRLWQITGRLPYGPLPRNMIVYELSNGELLLHSVIALEESAMAELEKLGRPTYMIIPNRYHRLDAKAYKERYPNIKIFCPKAAATYLKGVVEIDGFCEDELPSLGIEVFDPEGSKPFELIYNFKLDDGNALVMSDMMFNLKNMPGIQGFILKTIGSTGFFGTTGIGRILIVKDRKAFKNSLHQFANQMTNLKVICVAHGDAIIENCQAKFLAAIQRI